MELLTVSFNNKGVHILNNAIFYISNMLVTKVNKYNYCQLKDYIHFTIILN